MTFITNFARSDVELVKIILHVTFQIVEEVFSIADDLSECAQNRYINIISDGGYFFIVLHQEDTVKWNPQPGTHFINLKCRNIY